ncbi:MAG TPA: hypothetical protein VJJ79_03005 [Candidatus Nanoarchaeia archaeon]|nr:hypothetical protein [Candidatus Woesearchaeota archaeon]HLC22717.1 hypothetical protein [Candidatus Nanoarchaeia archaeon]
MVQDRASLIVLAIVAIVAIVGIIMIVTEKPEARPQLPEEMIVGQTTTAGCFDISTLNRRTTRRYCVER